MARIKRTIPQRDFTLMELRPDFREADDLEARGKSLKSARNMRVMATRAVQVRPGSVYVSEAPAAASMREIRPADGKVFGVLIYDDTISVIDTAGAEVWSDAAPWTDGARVWVEPFRENTLLGHPEDGIWVLAYDKGAWSLAPIVFEKTASNEVAQPYWAFHPNVSIQPSGFSGSVTVTASADVFTPEHVGTRIRYLNREISVTGYTNARSVSGTAASKLPPSWNVTVATSTDFTVGEAVVGADSDFQGVIVGITGDTLRVVTTDLYIDPEVNEILTSPKGSSTVTAVSSSTPFASNVWDEQLISPVHGFPRSAASAAGRLVFVDFPAVPDLICLSSARDIFDFATGADDDDAILRQEGENSPRFLHAINAGDLLLFSDRGCYLVPSRDSGVLTPQSFNAVLFDHRGASSVRPAAVRDGVIFVESNGEAISAAVLSGNVQLRWRVQDLTIFHDHLIKSPVAVCGPALDAPDPEKYIFVVNADGTMAAMSFVSELGAEGVGFAPWDTDGEFRFISPLFDGYYTLVDRHPTTGDVRLLERFDSSVYVDSATLFEGSGTGETALTGLDRMAGLTAWSMIGDASSGPIGVAEDGTATVPSAAGQNSVGLNFVAEVAPWPVEILETPRAGTFDARTITFIFTLLSARELTVRTNANRRTVGGYSWGDDLSLPPPIRDRTYRIPVFGRRQQPDLAIIKETPGPFYLGAIMQEVQG